MKQVLKKCFEPLFYKCLWQFALEDVLMNFCLLLPSFQRNFGRFLEYAWNTALALPPEFFVARKINRRTFYIDLRFKLDVVCICCYCAPRWCLYQLALPRSTSPPRLPSVAHGLYAGLSAVPRYSKSPRVSPSP